MFNYSNDQPNRQSNSKPQVYSKPRYYQPGTATKPTSSASQLAASRSLRNNNQNISQYYPVMPAMVSNPLAAFKARKDKLRRKVLDSYDIVGYIAAGTYGKYVFFPSFSSFFANWYRVYKAKSRNGYVHFCCGCSCGG